MKALAVLLVLVASVYADMYLQNPRGCNDRLNENNADRNNGNRLFNTENNARGGYAWGPAMTYYVGSKLPLQWTAQHGCGSDQVTCNIVVQYMCTNPKKDPASVAIRDGTTTNTIPDDPNQYNQQQNGQYVYGMHESYQYYQDCKARERNKGLFTADKTINGNNAQFTRQSPDGTKYGFQCNEERDYYPYWHPSPWKDIAVMSPNETLCDYFKSESQNVQSKGYCSGITANNNGQTPNNAAACGVAGGKWLTQPAWGLDAPSCQVAQFSRDNHLGNTLNGNTAEYNWTIPDEACASEGGCDCALRVRYNVSTANTANWPPQFDDSTKNGKNSPVIQNTIVELEGDELQMALNTNQYGRTFEDRSFTFHIAKRPSNIPDDAPIYNLNVRGKRGNIVQCFPATEYDFVPNNLNIVEGDYIHFQWTGSDNNPNGNAGQGTAGTDRTNIVQTHSLNHNLPMTSEQAEAGSPLFENADLRRHMAFLGQTNCPTIADLLKKNGNNQNAVNTDPTNCAKLNAAPAYFNAGAVRVNKTGTYYYMSSRNNDFSNRTQKGMITVAPAPPQLTSVNIAAIVVCTILAVLIVAGVAAFVYARKHPHSKLGHALAALPSLKRGSSLSYSSERKAPLLK